ncbi:MAG: glutamate--cysteine ligase [Betaproteobacteria bacterium]|nr:glutamate--cysteine ligase [Betaproteobacteria bacterium]
MNRLHQRLRILPREVLTGIRRGIEKESLRVRPDGLLADTLHPAALGSSLTHPHITTDFSESQLELITGIHADVDTCLAQLTEIHQLVYRHVGDELLWCTSMPCGLPADDDIPLGQYGRSNLGRAKTVYRNGLAHRYGRRMQTISGVHYNFSMPEAAWPILQRADASGGPVAAYQTDAYFHLIRNFRRHSWLLLYLFGASPTVCRSFVAGRAHALRELNAGTLFLPGATSLRMGPLGYQSDAQASLAVSFNSLRSYAGSLNGALTEPYPPYQAIGLRDGDDYRQLGTTLLQIENEFYGTIRPKPRFRSGERPLYALGERGVEYVEVRCMDNDPFCPIGIAADTMRFLDLFLLHCLLSDSPPDTPQEITAISRNQHDVAQRGRDPDVRLEYRGQKIGLAEWGAGLVEECEPIAAALDAAHRTSAYGDALSAAGAALRESSATRSGRMLAEIEQTHDKSYVAFALTQSLRHRRTLEDLPLPAEVNARYARMAEDSLEAQRKIEAADTVPFETYRRQYLSKDLLSGALLRSTS